MLLREAWAALEFCFQVRTSSKTKLTLQSCPHVCARLHCCGLMRPCALPFSLAGAWRPGLQPRGCTQHSIQCCWWRSPCSTAQQQHSALGTGGAGLDSAHLLAFFLPAAHCSYAPCHCGTQCLGSVQGFFEAAFAIFSPPVTGEVSLVKCVACVHSMLRHCNLQVPWRHAGYLWLAALVSLCIHEVRPCACCSDVCDYSIVHMIVRCRCRVLQRQTGAVLRLPQSGHALAAAAEGVPLHHIAFFMAVWVPGAYVVLDAESLAQLTPWRVLRVRFEHLCRH